MLTSTEIADSRTESRALDIGSVPFIQDVLCHKCVFEKTSTSHLGLSSLPGLVQPVGNKISQVTIC